MAKKYDCAFVDNEMPYGRVPQGHPVIVDYFYHEEIRGTENTGKEIANFAFAERSEGNQSPSGALISARFLDP